ncbi:hypothetical protein ABZ307_04765 [Streptomyces griseorubiginosus]|uniref:hypothetical protein n=1 Tax=Streptomyces griseorubiginosus TaxID=67304 RepID=UPI0033BF5648
MTSHPVFGVMLARLMDHRRTDVVRLSSQSGIPGRELTRVLSGVPPSASHLDRLAQALGFHTADLHVIAGVPVPHAPAPRDAAAGAEIVRLVQITRALPSEHRAHVRRLVEQVPPASGERASAPRSLYDQQEGGFGAMLVNLLSANRNLPAPVVVAKTLAVLTEGRVYLAASTISGIGRGRVPLTPEWVAGFAAALGIPAGDLAAVTGAECAESSWSAGPTTAEAAELLWNSRHLTREQALRVRSEAETLLVAVPDDASDEDWNRVRHQHGRWWGAPRS